MNPESEDKTPEIEFINNIILEKKINFTSKEWAIIRKNHLKIDLNIDVSLRNFFKKILKDFLLSITCDEEVLETYLKEFNGSIENPLDIRKFKEEFENFTKSFTNKNNRINDKINKINNSLKYIYTYEEAHKEQFFIKDMEKEIFNEAHIFFHDILSTNGNFKSNILLINYNIFLINIKDKIIDLDKDLNEILDYYTYLKHIIETNTLEIFPLEKDEYVILPQNYNPDRHIFKNEKIKILKEKLKKIEENVLNQSMNEIY